MRRSSSENASSRKSSASTSLHIMTTMSEKALRVLNEWTTVTYLQMARESLMTKPSWVAQGAKRLCSLNLRMFSSVW